MANPTVTLTIEDVISGAIPVDQPHLIDWLGQTVVSASDTDGDIFMVCEASGWRGSKNLNNQPTRLVICSSSGKVLTVKAKDVVAIDWAKFAERLSQKHPRWFLASLALRGYRTWKARAVNRQQAIFNSKTDPTGRKWGQLATRRKLGLVKKRK